MSDIYDRRFQILVDDKVFIDETGESQFKIEFRVLHDFGGFNSYMDLALYNLSADTSRDLFVRGSNIKLRAGYKDSIDVIFSGTMRNALYERNGPSTITRVLCRGGKLPENRPEVNISLGNNSTVQSAIKECVKALGHKIVIDDSQFEGMNKLIRGMSLSGDPLVELNRLSESFGFSYVIEGDRVVVNVLGKHRAGEPHLISQFTGMVGIPEISDVGIDVVTKLNPKIKIGGQFKVESDLKTFNVGNTFYRDIPETIGKGTFNIFRVTHTGDSWGDDWNTAIVGYKGEQQKSA
jgi:hypothetical protein